MSIRAGVVGGSGYTGAEILRILGSHPAIDAVYATSREFAGAAIAEVYPNLTTDLHFSAFDPGSVPDLDLVFLALPHGASMEVAGAMRDAGAAVVDLSADFRLHDPAAYPRWFGAPHHAPDALADWVYGLPELHRPAIAGARAVANPGCYPTAAILALAPLIDAGLVERDGIVVSAASGVSGAGRGVGAGVHFSHVDANFKAYGFPTHKHTPEIEQELGALAGEALTLSFIPHLAPMPRGILATCVARRATGGDATDAAAGFYAGEPFVRVLASGLPETKYTTGSNRCLLGYQSDERTGTVVAVAAIDNLGKGAAGQAVQNANLMLGLDETLGLTGGGLYP